MKYLYCMIGLLALAAGCRSVEYRDPHRLHGAARLSRAVDESPQSLEEMKARWRVEVEGYMLTFKPEPEYPGAGQTVNLELTIQRNLKGAVVPVSKATVGCRTHLPSVTGRVHFAESHIYLIESAPGVYAGAAVFPVGHDWEVDFNVVTPGGRSIGVDFPLKVSAFAKPAPPSGETEALREAH